RGHLGGVAPGPALGQEQFLEAGLDVVQEQPATGLPEPPVQGVELADQDAGHRGQLSEIQVQVGQATLQDQFEQVVGQDGKGRRVQVSIGELDQGAVLEVLDLPGMRDDVQRHDGTSSVGASPQPPGCGGESGDEREYTSPGSAATAAGENGL